MLKLSKAYSTDVQESLPAISLHENYAIIIVRAHMHMQACVTFHKIAHIALHDHACTLNNLVVKNRSRSSPRERFVYVAIIP